MYLVSGTSGSAPTVAAILTRINGERIAQGQPALGFVNPAIYSIYASNATVFNDVVEGENNCCAAVADPICCDSGFTARTGYDPVTGLGSFNFAKLRDALLAMKRGPVPLDLERVASGLPPLDTRRSIVSNSSRTTKIPTTTRDGRWVSDSIPASTELMRLTFALHLKHPLELERLLYEVSTPGTTSYGELLTLDAVNRRFPAVDGGSVAVEKWLRTGAGSTAITIDTSAVGFVEATVTVETVETLFGVTVRRWRSTMDPSIRTLRAVRRALCAGAPPSALADTVAFVRGVDVFPSHKRTHATGVPTTLSEAAQRKSSRLGTDPNTLRSSYGVPTTLACTNANSSQATANFLGEGFAPADLKFFYECFDPVADAQTVSKIVGNNHDPSLEASLDVQYITSMGAGAETWWISDDETHGTPAQEPFLDYMLLLAKTAGIPWVHSISYADTEGTVDLAYAQRVDLEFMKAGLRGLSLLVASGDDGAGCDAKKDHFVVEWPSSSPYITAVGATEMPTSSTSADATAGEQAAEFSGGGFSSLFVRPKYQDAAVSHYLATAGHAPSAPTTFYNTSGRAVPDVSAMGTLYDVIVDQSPTIVAGTSASTPTWAGIVTLLNDARFNAALPPLGFLNPLFYSLKGAESGGAAAFRDIAVGASTPGGMIGSDCGEGTSGWKAVAGYDLSTGLGVPVFPALKAAVLNRTLLFSVEP